MLWAKWPESMLCDTMIFYGSKLFLLLHFHLSYSYIVHSKIEINTFQDAEKGGIAKRKQRGRTMKNGKYGRSNDKGAIERRK